jgi:RNA polymerase sporulation-specific sigma factor
MASAWALTVSIHRSDEQLVAAWHAGDPVAIEQLLRRYRRFARSKARTYFLVGADADDVEQEGLIGLFKAARDFQPERQVSFRAFAELCVTRQVISAIKTAARRKHRPLNDSISISGTRAAEDGSERSLEDVLNDHRTLDPADEVVSHERLRAIRRSMTEKLSPLEVDVLGLYIAGQSYDEIGRQLGRGTKTIDNALQRIKRKLDVELADHEPALVA